MNVQVLLFLLMARLVLGHRLVLCEISQKESVCTVRKLILEETNSHFSPVANKIESGSIQKVVVEESRIPVLTAGVCESFSGLAVLEAEDAGVVDVQEDALRSCPELKELNLKGNSIRSLPSSLFNSNQKLTYLNLASNSIRQFQPGLLNFAESLSYLNLEFNQIEEFSENLMSHLSQLRELYVSSNELIDFNVSAAVTKMPKLRFSSIQNNNIWCERLTFIEDSWSRQVPQIVIRKSFSELGAACLGSKTEWETLKMVKKFHKIESRLAEGMEKIRKLEEANAIMRNQLKKLVPQTDLVLVQTSLKPLKCRTECYDPDQEVKR